ncbi:MAG: hypothetical protein MUE71_00475 [Chitinophagaceae bacterium]|nr:hypothetical protein [Chitinophagaceae bacterium]
MPPPETTDRVINPLFSNSLKSSAKLKFWHCFLLFATLYSCRQSSSVINGLHQSETDTLKLGHYKNEVYPRIESLAKTGYIITRMGKDITSLLMSKLNPEDSSFSHCGVISFEHDSAFVYHCIGGEWNPDQKMKREWLFHFLHPADSKRTGLFDLKIPDSTKMAMIHQVRRWHREGLQFDMDFNLQTNDKMYCTEMVAKALQFASGNKELITPLTIDSVKFIPVDRIIQRKNSKEILRMEY